MFINPMRFCDRRRTTSLSLFPGSELIPVDTDVDGKAAGILVVRNIAERAGASASAVVRALMHWRRWRVFWIRFVRDPRGATWDVRFERAVVEQALTARTDSSRAVELLRAHQETRGGKPQERWPRVPKPTTGAETKELEVMATPGVQ